MTEGTAKPAQLIVDLEVMADEPLGALCAEAADMLKAQSLTISNQDAEIKRLHAFVEWVHLYTNDPDISAEASKYLGAYYEGETND